VRESRDGEEKKPRGKEEKIKRRARRVGRQGAGSEERCFAALRMTVCGVHEERRYTDGRVFGPASCL
jgi:hypothetical protein